MLSNDGLMAMRIYSLYNQSRPLLVFFGVLLLDVIIIGCVCVLLYIWDILPAGLMKTYCTVGSGLLSIIRYITILVVFGAHAHHWLFRRSLYDIWPVSQSTASGRFAHLMLVIFIHRALRAYISMYSKKIARHNLICILFTDMAMVWGAQLVVDYEVRFVHLLFTPKWLQMIYAECKWFTPNANDICWMQTIYAECKWFMPNACVIIYEEW